MLLVQLLPVAVNLSLLFLMKFSRPRIDESGQTSCSFFCWQWAFLSMSSSSSSICRAASTDIPDPLLPLFPIVHRLRQVFRATTCILPELLYVCSSWSSCFYSAICGVHWSTSLMNSFLLLQLYPVCLVRLTWIVFVMGGRWPYSWCLVGCCLQDSFNIARIIPSSASI